MRNEFNRVGNDVESTFKKFTDFEPETKFPVSYFISYTSTFGRVVMVVSEDCVLKLPARFNKLFDTEEKISYWNKQRNLVITYYGIVNNNICFNISEYTKVKIIDKKLYIDGYVYLRRLQSTKGRTYWDCQKVRSGKCKGRAITEIGDEVIVLKGPAQSEHTHLPKPQLE
jgi:hypothetical protein